MSLSVNLTTTTGNKISDLTGIDEMVELRPQLNSIYNGTVHGGTQMSSLVSVANINMQMIDAQMINVGFEVLRIPLNLLIFQESNLTVYRGSPAAYTFKQNYTYVTFKPFKYKFSIISGEHSWKAHCLCLSVVLLYSLWSAVARRFLRLKVDIYYIDLNEWK